MDWIRAVEAIYQIDEPSHERWLSSLIEPVAPLFGPSGREIVASLFHMGERGLRIFAASHDEAAIFVATNRLSEEEPALLVKSFGGVPVATMSSHVGRAAFRRSKAFARNFHPLEARDALGLLARDGGPWGVCLCTSLPDIRRVTAEEAAPLQRVAAHIHAALRLRFLAYGDPASPVDVHTPKVLLSMGADAVLSPSGKALHLEPVAQGHAAALRIAAVAIDRARARTRREDPNAALEAWRARVHGEWSLVDSFDSDNRRFLVARRNPVHQANLPSLSRREREVLGLRARLHGVKLIAYELGVSPATVSRELRTGMRKLGMKRTIDLVSLLEGERKGESS